MRKGKLLVLIVLCCWLGAWQPAWAQSDGQLHLDLDRDWGYGGFGEIQGLFTLSASGPDDLDRVAFMIDGEQIGEDEEAPFALQFNTDTYPAGLRTLSAVGYTLAGGELHSNEIQVEFVSAQDARKAVVTIILPVAGLVVGIVVLVLAGTLLAARRRGGVPLGQPRKYGISGGTICPKCQRPFALSFLSLNLLTRRLTPCPHCGKWVVVRSRPLAELRAAEAAELEQVQESGQVSEHSAEEKLRRGLDESRYQDL